MACSSTYNNNLYKTIHTISNLDHLINRQNMANLLGYMSIANDWTLILWLQQESISEFESILKCLLDVLWWISQGKIIPKKILKIPKNK